MLMLRFIVALIFSAFVTAASAQPLTTKPSLTDMLTANCDATHMLLGGAVSPGCGPAGTLAGDLMYFNGTIWVKLAGNNSGTKVLQETSAGVPSWVASGVGVASFNGQTGAVVSYFPPQGRLTLQTLTPVMTTSQSGKTTIFYTPYAGNMVSIYDGTNMSPTAVAEISVATTDTTKSPAVIGANKVNDWFVWNDSGTIRIGHGPDWTNDTTRSAGTALVMVNGILLNNASITNGPAASRGTYVGTTRSDGSSQLNWVFGTAASGGGAALLNIWNAYNRVNVGTRVQDNGSSYTYTSATVRQARASAGNQVMYVVGMATDAVSASNSSYATTVGVAFATCIVGLGIDSTSANTVSNNLVAPASGASVQGTLFAGGVLNPGLGVHIISANEAGDGSNANTFDQAPTQTGIFFSLMM